ncbi:hypothetical protein ACNKHS_00430 [Shigella flexneri]
MKQLPGLAVQRLMQQGYGFAGEGDWKTAALLRIMKVMSTGIQGGASLSEDYTSHLERQPPVLRLAHAESMPLHGRRRETNPRRADLGIGGKAIQPV